MTYLLKRTDQGGGYVAPSGSSSSYTRNPLRARRYPTKEQAERCRCPENEVIVNYHDLVR